MPEPIAPRPSTPPIPPAPKAAGELPSFSDLLSETWEWFPKHATMMIKLYAVSLIWPLIAGIASIFLSGPASSLLNSSSSLSRNYLLFLAFLVVGGLVSAIVYLRIFIAQYVYLIKNDPSLKVSDTIKLSGPFVWPFFSTSLLLGLIIFGGYLLLIIPGIYWGVQYMYAPVLVLIEGTKKDTLRMSKELVKGYWWAIVTRGFIFAIIIYVASTLINYIFNTIFTLLGHLYFPLTYLSLVPNLLVTLILTPFSLAFSYRLFVALRRVKGQPEPALAQPVNQAPS